MKLPRAFHLPPEELAGQVLMPMIDCRFKNRHSAAAREIFRMLHRFHVGGFILFYGHPADIKFSTTALQRESRYPLLLGADVERGLRSVFSEGTLFPHALAFGAAGETHLAEAFADILAQEIRSVGINVFFGPSLDLANDRDNPIINIRAFHSSADVVSKLSGTIIRKVQEFGIACVGKHFPGHGATKTDSHSSLPELYKSLSELQKEELLPYPAAINAGVKGLMASHLKVAGFTKPASLEEGLLRKIIREDWNYRGVVFTDALEMAAIQDSFRPREQVFLPLEAGADVLLMPAQLPLAHRLLVERIARDETFRRTVEQAVERIFDLKKWIHKQQPKQDHPYRVNKTVAFPAHLGVAGKIAERAVTLVHQSERFPLDLPKVSSIHHAIFTDSPFSDQPLQRFCELLARFFEKAIILINPAADLSPDSQAPDVIIISLYFRTFAGNPQKLDWKSVEQFLKRFENAGAVKIVFLFGNPYRLNELPRANVDAVFLIYSYVAVSQEAAFNALLSFNDVQGELPVALKAPFHVAKSLPAKSYALFSGQPARSSWKTIDKMMENAIQEKVFPGGVLLAARQGEILLHNSYGRFDYASDAPPVTPETIYDLASLTKVAATTPAVMKLLETRQLRLSDTLEDFYPGLENDAKADITIADLLAHQGGFPAWKPFYESAGSGVEFVNRILETPLEYAPGEKAVYSDLGFILLFDIVEKISGMPFDIFCREQLFQPLGLNSLRFHPPAKLRRRIPPTGRDALRAETIQGEVNDANCFTLGGVSGHAGLFGNAAEVAAIGQLFIQKGIYNRQRIFKASTVENFSRIYHPGVSARALGWDTPTPPSSSGTYFSKRTIGHLGFTGTSLWVDLQREIIIVLLCNRVQPDAQNDRIKEFRPQIHDALMRKLLKNQS